MRSEHSAVPHYSPLSTHGDRRIHVTIPTLGRKRSSVKSSSQLICFATLAFALAATAEAPAQQEPSGRNLVPATRLASLSMPTGAVDSQDSSDPEAVALLSRFLELSGGAVSMEQQVLSVDFAVSPSPAGKGTVQSLDMAFNRSKEMRLRRGGQSAPPEQTHLSSNANLTPVRPSNKAPARDGHLLLTQFAPAIAAHRMLESSRFILKNAQDAKCAQSSRCVSVYHKDDSTVAPCEQVWVFSEQSVLTAILYRRPATAEVSHANQQLIEYSSFQSVSGHQFPQALVVRAPGLAPRFINTIHVSITANSAEGAPQ